MTQLMTFISYSRRQLYFAESLALHLQNEGLEVWFDLQELQAGSVWSDGLKQGVGDAGQMVLVVSKASLDSPYTQDEWKDFTAKGNRLVLAIFEPVTLPDMLRGLPTYDLRRGFGRKVRALAAYLRSEAEPRHDRVPAPRLRGLPGKLPGGLWAVLSGLFATVIACLVGLFLAGFGQFWDPQTTPGEPTFILGLLAVSLVIAGWYGVRLLYRKLEYKKLKRGVLIALLSLVPSFFAVTNFVNDFKGFTDIWPSQILCIAILIWALFVYLVVLRRSAGLLRWMPPEEALQAMRRRVHLPLARTSLGSDQHTEQSTSGVPTYAIHTDPADAPLARIVERVFCKNGHRRVAETASPQHHIAILSNRSSQAWVQQVTQAYASSLVFIVASTIEFKDTLAETSRYQWVDARNGKMRDIAALAHSLADADRHKREVALEATPAMIDDWKVPDGITLQKRVMEIVAIFLLVFGLTDMVGFVMEYLGFYFGGTGYPKKSFVLVLISAVFLWLASRALVYRKVAAPLFYCALAVGLALVVWLQIFPNEAAWEKNPVTLWTQYWWAAPVVILALSTYAASTSFFWLPTFASVHSDEVGIKASIDRSFRRKNLIIVAAWVITIVGIVFWNIWKEVGQI